MKWNRYLHIFFDVIILIIHLSHYHMRMSIARKNNCNYFKRYAEHHLWRICGTNKCNMALPLVKDIIGKILLDNPDRYLRDSSRYVCNMTNNH